MDMSIELQEILRDGVIKNIELNKLEHLIHDRSQLLIEMNRLLDRVVEQQNIYINNHDQLEMAECMADEIIGFGPIRPLLEDETINDILVNGPENIFIERNGKLELTNLRFINNAQLTDIAKRLVQKVGRRLDESQPLVDARLSDGSRLNVVTQPIALDGTAISIRKFSKSNIELADLIRFGTMNGQMANFLIVAARCRLNIIISGGTGSGKTTLLNALSKYIDPGERIITMEDAAELRLMQPHVLRMETRLAGVENTGQITMRSLLVNALRMRPDRIIVGECRGEESFEMLQAMNTGHDGSMSTLHANNPRDAISRLENMVMMAGMNIPIESIRRNIVSAVNIIIQATRLNDGSRKIMNISEVMGIEGDCVILQDIFSFESQSERDEQGAIKGEFVNHGLLMRSAVMRNSIMFNLNRELKQIFGME
ncbi:pilus assembly protein CpaF [Pectobacterium odoriferum]|uniref:Pilus assembly protein CpaF n=1 Tax=Pectobacterium odoriferum TaxID=78398 RepID=A0ABD6VU57_9GAMM|nr:CpaF family protein [Pectobacterium odoriferum]POD97225.1 pilus assembly protein CpaF [Pectobacterium odoriferum]POE15215.1 pilus assembly protein CpaF [Pectobacterium odoriferum]POE24170.1 pilus assembly protein CpaF [Pectobacterium odoriferum]POE28752.1 pilus assembly protein CpaF [Pectobacterium odoriferum]POE34102.1 pilus assembly protein CpaF [Pectobacterium odoriferum]